MTKAQGGRGAGPQAQGRRCRAAEASACQGRATPSAPPTTTTATLVPAGSARPSPGQHWRWPHPAPESRRPAATKGMEMEVGGVRRGGANRQQQRGSPSAASTPPHLKQRAGETKELALADRQVVAGLLRGLWGGVQGWKGGQAGTGWGREGPGGRAGRAVQSPRQRPAPVFPQPGPHLHVRVQASQRRHCAAQLRRAQHLPQPEVLKPAPRVQVAAQRACGRVAGWQVASEWVSTRVGKWVGPTALAAHPPNRPRTHLVHPPTHPPEKSTGS